MDNEILFTSAFRGTKNYTQQDIVTANATGFGAAADDFAERGIDLNETLIKNKPATYFFRMNSDAMEGAGIHVGDMLIVDRSIKPVNGKIIIAAVNGELLVRRFTLSFNRMVLSPENRRFNTIEIGEFTQFNTWGVVTYIIQNAP